MDPENRKERLFVYGTLGPEGPNRYLLTQIGGTWRSASVRGRLRNVGWGAAMGYLAIELDPSAEPVHGHVFESEHLPGHWDELDVYEGPDYERIVTNVEFQDQTRIDAFIYVARRSPRERETPPRNSPV